MGSLNINESDLDSPGYEYLRSHRNMINLYYKLIALDYRPNFCPAYKCPPINQYYFSRCHQNKFEQQFVFTCMCAWLIRDKCQMNFDLDLLEDMSASINVIYEALKLLHEDGGYLDIKIRVRLEQGYGPEVIYALNCFADRALVVVNQDQAGSNLGPSGEIYFHNKLYDRTRTATNSITLAKLINVNVAGGGGGGGNQTSRTLSKFPIEENPLLALDYDDYLATKTNLQSTLADPTLEWEQQVAKVADQLTSSDNYLSGVKMGEEEEEEKVEEEKGEEKEKDWQDYLNRLATSKQAIASFLIQFKSIVEAIEARVNRQMRVLSQREHFLQANLTHQLDNFTSVWNKRFATARDRNEELMKLANAREELLDSYSSRLGMLTGNIETRTSELNDVARLRELESVTSHLEAQSDVLDVKVGLLLGVYGGQELT